MKITIELNELSELKTLTDFLSAAPGATVVQVKHSSPAVPVATQAPVVVKAPVVAQAPIPAPATTQPPVPVVTEAPAPVARPTPLPSVPQGNQDAVKAIGPVLQKLGKALGSPAEAFKAYRGLAESLGIPVGFANCPSDRIAEVVSALESFAPAT